MAGRERDCLRQHDGVWRWEDRGYLTACLSDVVRARMGEQEPALLALGELLAFGEVLPLPMVEDLACRAAVEAAERRGLVKMTTSGSRWEVRLEQALFGPLLRATTPRSREQEVWRQLAQAAERSPMRRSDDIMLAAKWRPARRTGEPTGLAARRRGAGGRAARPGLGRGAGRAGPQRGGRSKGGAHARGNARTPRTVRGRLARASRHRGLLEAPDRSRWKIVRRWIHYLGNSEQPLGPPDDERDATGAGVVCLAAGRRGPQRSGPQPEPGGADGRPGRVRGGDQAAAVLLVAAGLCWDSRSRRPASFPWHSRPLSAAATGIPWDPPRSPRPDASH
jgi:hypothetical protein